MHARSAFVLPMVPRRNRRDAVRMPLAALFGALLAGAIATGLAAGVLLDRMPGLLVAWPLLLYAAAHTVCAALLGTRASVARHALPLCAAATALAAAGGGTGWSLLAASAASALLGLGSGYALLAQRIALARGSLPQARMRRGTVAAVCRWLGFGVGVTASVPLAVTASVTAAVALWLFAAWLARSVPAPAAPRPGTTRAPALLVIASTLRGWASASAALPALQAAFVCLGPSGMYLSPLLVALLLGAMLGAAKIARLLVARPSARVVSWLQWTALLATGLAALVLFAAPGVAALLLGVGLLLGGSTTEPVLGRSSAARVQTSRGWSAGFGIGTFAAAFAVGLLPNAAIDPMLRAPGAAALLLVAVAALRRIG